MSAALDYTATNRARGYVIVSASQQSAILGTSNAARFRAGTLSLRDAIDTDRRVVTLSQLAVKLGIPPRAAVTRAT